MKTNTRKTGRVFNHAGGKADPVTAIRGLRRIVFSSMLWEDQFYENGLTTAEMISEYVAQVPADVACAIAIEAREKHHLRHVPLWILVSVCEDRNGAATGSLIADTIARVISRVDELSELVALWWKTIRRPLPCQMRKGLRKAFTKFTAYQFQKYGSRQAEVKLRDVMFLVHPKPITEEQSIVFKQIANNSLPAADTWEVALSAGHDKAEVFTRLLREGGLGYLALLRNLRGMTEAGVDPSLIRAAIIQRKGAGRVLPFRYVAAARACPAMEPYLDVAMGEAISEMPSLPGRTIVLVDVSGSMDDQLSSHSDLKRMDAAAALASIINAEDLRVFTFSNTLVEVAPRRGMAGVDAVVKSQSHGGTALGAAVREVNKHPHDRLIVITDEQSQDGYGIPVAKRAYMINVASYRHGVEHGRWTKINGFSESVIRFIHEFEGCDAEA